MIRPLRRYPCLAEPAVVAVLRSLRDDGPGTAEDLCERLGLTIQQACARTSILRVAGLADYPIPPEHKPRIHRITEAGRKALVDLDARDAERMETC